MIEIIAGTTDLHDEFSVVSLGAGHIYATEVLAVAGLRRFS
jgi:hypothetical protein